MDHIEETRQRDNASTVWVGRPVRQGWADAAHEMVRRGDDMLPDSLTDTAFDEGGVRGMRESSTYQVILAEGRVEGRIEEARDILLRQGRKRFGPPDERVQATLRAISSRERLEALSERLLDVTTWQELLAD